ncbi:MAG: acyl--CoA ligase, partial [Candidatus Coatesbacteria bacterium]|nr:acyl--CoA ligase [Candidatus Coatesbacteria bacterium]
MNVAQMCAARAESFPNKTAIVHKDLSLDFETLHGLVERCAAGLHGRGLGKGSRISLLLEKTPELVISFIAAARLGSLVVPLNYQLRPAVLGKIISDYNIDCLVVGAKFLKLLSDVPTGHKALEKLVVCEAGADQAENLIRFEDLLDQGADGLEQIEVDDDEPFYLNFTSGTTGIPRAAVTTHANLFYNTIASVETLGLRHNDVHLCMFPAYLHPHEIFLRGVYLGGASVLENSLFPKSVAKAVSEHGVTCMMGAATLYERLLPFAGNPEFDYGSLRIAESGGMITRETLNRAFEAAFGVPITPVWGSTETAG